MSEYTVGQTCVSFPIEAKSNELRAMSLLEQVMEAFAEQELELHPPENMPAGNVIQLSMPESVSAVSAAKVRIAKWFADKYGTKV
jgi:hypothetical protein